MTNYRQFNETLEFDLTASNYTYNQECTKNGLIKLALIYGQNGTGKTSLSRAIFDSVSHLTDNTVSKSHKFFINANSLETYARFKLEFLFQENNKSHIVIYEYQKDDKEILITEKLNINGDDVIKYELGKPLITTLKGTESLNKSLNPSQNLSALKYVFSNTSLNSNRKLDKRSVNNKLFLKFIKFVQEMLLFRNVFDGVDFIGKDYGANSILESIIEKNNLEDFEVFLRNCGLDFNLEAVDGLEGKTIGIKFPNKILPFFNIVSTGTKSLTLFYFWWQNFSTKIEPNLLFIDEFDASYHFALSEKIVQKLKDLPDTQVILTTHNTNLLSNDLIRPDCGYIIDGKEIKSLTNCTEKELRQAHNLERLYQAGAFNV